MARLFTLTDSGRRKVRFTLASMVTTALLVVAGVPSVSAGSASDPEIMDAAQDVSPLAFATNTAANKSLFANASAYDVVKSWIGAESASHFLLFIQVRDLPEAWAAGKSPPSASPFGANASFAGTSLVANFSVAGHQYWAIAKLAYLGEEAGLVDNYTLWRDGREWVPLSGAYNTSRDQVSMRIPKDTMGASDNVLLQKFWILGRFGNFSMDFAPNARDPALPSITSPPDPVQLSKQIAAGKVVAPTYGRDYAFGQYYHAPGASPTTSGLLPLPSDTNGPSPVAPNLKISIQGLSQKTIRSGESATYDVSLKNDALSSDTVYLTLSSPSSGWDHHLSQTQLSLASGEERAVLLTVAAASGASGTLRTSIDVSSALGDSKSAAVMTFVDSGSSQQPNDDTDLPVIPVPNEGKKDTPGFVALAILATFAVVAVAIRRGTR